LLLHAAEEKLIWIHPPLAPGDNEFGDAAAQQHPCASQRNQPNAGENDLGTFSPSLAGSLRINSGRVLHSPTAAFHRQSNRMVEGLHRTMKKQGGTADWASHMPWVMLGLRANLKTRVECQQEKQPLESR